MTRPDQPPKKPYGNPPKKTPAAAKKHAKTPAEKRMQRLRESALAIQQEQQAINARIRKDWAKIEAKKASEQEGQHVVQALPQPDLVFHPSTLRSLVKLSREVNLFLPKGIAFPSGLWQMITPQLAMTKQEIRLLRMRLWEEERLRARTIMISAPITGNQTGPRAQRLLEAINKPRNPQLPSG
jgi:hypothetical protein